MCLCCCSASDVVSLLLSRAMAVLEPLKVTISNFTASEPTEIEVPDFPADESKGSHRVPFEKTVYIEQSDFREVRHGSFSVFII